MPAITQAELAEQIEEALDTEADVVVDPAEARRRVAEKIASAVNDFVVGRTVNVAGVQTGSSTTTGTVANI